MNNEKHILAKLLKIAQNQQKIITKLAQTIAENPSGNVSTPPQQDPNIEYIMSGIPVAAVNAGITNVVVTKVDKHPSASSDSGATMNETYMAHIQANPGKHGEAFKQIWEKQLATQKPDLVGRVGFIFEG